MPVQAVQTRGIARFDSAPMAADAIETLIRRFPERASTVRCLGARDPSFRSICDDYAEARRALEHWQAARPAAPERVAEYRQSLEELEAEALAILEAFEG